MYELAESVLSQAVTDRASGTAVVDGQICLPSGERDETVAKVRVLYSDSTPSHMIHLASSPNVCYYWPRKTSGHMGYALRVHARLCLCPEAKRACYFGLCKSP